jgi:hypothetical protein
MLFVRGTIPSGSNYLKYQDSTQGVPTWFTPIGFALLLYLGIRVYLALRKKDNS